jgi:UPF0755 protein
MKKLLRWSSLFALVALLFISWALLGPASGGHGRQFLYIPTGHADKATVMDSLSHSGLLSHPGLFSALAGASGVWEKLKPGRYEVTPGMSLLGVVRMLRNGRQSQVRIVITKLRTKEDLARVAGKFLECDSTSVMQLLSNNDSLAQYGLDSNTVMTAVIPNTYLLNWNTSAPRLLKRMVGERNGFWTVERRRKAEKLGLRPEEVYILASIVEEESNKNDEKPRIASTYLNRLHKPMRLSADPTVKFALRDFTLKRIYLSHIDAAASSPYNTYKHAGLPPGPICTPSMKSIDAVLDAEKTDYLFFCARPDFSGYHDFASTEEQHFRNAKAYQHALDSLLIK